jgi:hypothetical protein
MEGEIDGQRLTAEGVVNPLVPARRWVPDVSYSFPREQHPKAIRPDTIAIQETYLIPVRDWGEAGQQCEDRNGQQ